MKTYENFDPFVELDPTPAFIKSVLKDLKSQASALLVAQRNIPEWGDFVREELQIAHKKTCKRIELLDFRLRTYERTGRWDTPQTQPGRIREQDIAQAKSIPIADLYGGKLRRSGKRWFGKCPFHSEKSGSFVIYPTNDFHCFGCGANGDSIAFVMKQRNLDFINAIKFMLHI